MRILVIAPHADDEILGAGGMMLRRIAEGDSVSICIVTRGTEPLFSDEYMQKLRAETLECHRRLGAEKTYFLEFPAVTLEQQERFRLNDAIREVLVQSQPDEVYLPHWGDMQKDHAIVAEAAMVALRPKYDNVPRRVYAYETLSETGWNVPNVHNQFIPTSYVEIGDYLDQKLALMGVYASQLAQFPQARSLEALRALALHRGSMMGLRAAEAFVLIREIR